MKTCGPLRLCQVVKLATELVQYVRCLCDKYMNVFSAKSVLYIREGWGMGYSWH